MKWSLKYWLIGVSGFIIISLLGWILEYFLMLYFNLSQVMDSVVGIIIVISLWNWFDNNVLKPVELEE